MKKNRKSFFCCCLSFFFIKFARLLLNHIPALSHTAGSCRIILFYFIIVIIFILCLFNQENSIFSRCFFNRGRQRHVQRNYS